MTRPKMKPMDRRSFLRGTGALLTLPFLEAMLPETAHAQAAVMPKRLGVFCFPHGTYDNAWRPSTFGTGFSFPANLQSLAPYRNRVILTWGLGAHGLAQGSHGACTPYFITEPIEGCEFRVRSKSADMIISDYLRQSNPSLQPLVTKPPDSHGYPGCASHGQWRFESGMQLYLSWTGNTSYASQISSPQAVFDKLFAGAGTTIPTTDPVLAYRKARGLSVLDAVLSQASSLNNKLGAADKQKIDQYFTAIREVERTIQATNTNGPPVMTCNPGARPSNSMPFDQMTNVYLDLAVLAMACDKARVVTHLLDNELSDRTMPWIGVHTGHHYLSHYNTSEGGIAASEKPPLYLRVTEWYASRLAYLLGKMQSYQEGDRDLLYNSVIVYGSGMGPTGRHHDHTDLPVVIAGELGGTIRTGQALNCANTRMANLWLAIMHRFGINQSSYASSTGALNLS